MTATSHIPQTEIESYPLQSLHIVKIEVEIMLPQVRQQLYALRAEIHNLIAIGLVYSV